MLGDWLLRDLKRRHINQLAAHLLVEHGRAAEGARGILRVLSALIEDAIGDELAEVNPVKGVVRANDPRARKQPCPLRVFSFDELHAFAVTAGTAWLAEKQHHAAGYVPVVRALVRMFSDRPTAQWTFGCNLGVDRDSSVSLADGPANGWDFPNYCGNPGTNQGTCPGPGDGVAVRPNGHVTLTRTITLPKRFRAKSAAIVPNGVL
jgi:hypothetical protein